VGAAADFEYLAYLLREAVAPPDVEGPAFQEARLRLLGEAAEAVETPAGRVAAELRAQVAPELPPLAGTPASVQALGGARVREVWMRTHQASAMTLLVSAPVVPEVVLAATRGMGAPEEGAAPPLDARLPAPRVPEPQALRSWYGEAWTVAAPGDPRSLVIASLVADRLRRGPQEMQASVELWELPGRAVLAVVGSAPGPGAAAMRRTVSGTLAAVRSSLDRTSVASAVAALRQDLLLESRTSAGLVALVGRALEAEGDPWAADRQREALLSLDEAAVRALLDEMLRQAPRSAQVRP
jgi:predicted Zn-dependent peptidase